jgi:hypothetical protein
MKHAGDSLFLMSSESSLFIERAVLLRGMKRKTSVTIPADAGLAPAAVAAYL